MRIVRIRRWRKVSIRDTAGTGKPGLGCMAFTLVELLIVLAVLGVLAALLLPALGRGRSLAKQTACLAQVRQFSMSLQLYAAEQQDWMPREGFHTNGIVGWNNWNQVRNPQAADVWYNNLTPYSGFRGAATYGEVTERAAFYSGRSGYRCPAVRIPEMARPPTFQIPLFSLAMNSQLVEPHNAPATRFGLIPNPSIMVLFTDNRLEGERLIVAEQSTSDLGQPASTANRFPCFRHGTGGNLAFADGRAQWFAGARIVETNGINRGWIRMPEDQIAWNLP